MIKLLALSLVVAATSCLISEAGNIRTFHRFHGSGRAPHQVMNRQEPSPREHSVVRDDSHRASGNDIIDAVNDFRQRNGKPPLVQDAVLQRVADQRAPHYSHVVNGEWSWDTANRLGFTGRVTDNLAQGYSDGPDAVRGWSHDEGHRVQMLGFFKMNGRYQDYNFNSIGAARCGSNFIAVFGHR